MRSSSLLLTLFVLFALAAPVAAQEASVVGPTEIEAALENHAASADADREAVRRVLRTPEVRAVAEGMGVETERLEDAAGMIAGERLAEAAEHARAIEKQLAGGQTISFNTTTLIIVLLLVIVVVLIAD